MAKAVCDRCGFTVKHDACRVEWSGLFVCRDCYDPRPPWLSPPVISSKEGAPLPNARLHPDPVYADDDNPVTGDDL
jgi:hypothetical protein